MQVIWKWEIPTFETFEMYLPVSAQELCVQVQSGIPTLWLLVDPTAPYDKRTYHVIGTGWERENMGRYIGTFQMDGGALVWHLFAEPASVLV